MEYSDSNDMVDVEVVRLQSNYPMDDPFEIEYVRSLCHAFSFGLKIINQYENGKESCRQYELYYTPDSFLSEGLRNVIKTFILSSGITYLNDKKIQMKLYDYIDMPTDGIFVEENLVSHKPTEKN